MRQSERGWRDFAGEVREPGRVGQVEDEGVGVRPALGLEDALDGLDVQTEGAMTDRNRSDD